ncbi:hypothetical protein GCM10027262_52750 [Nocardia tengchongensis]
MAWGDSATVGDSTVVHMNIILSEGALGVAFGMYPLSPPHASAGSDHSAAGIRSEGARCPTLGWVEDQPSRVAMVSEIMAIESRGLSAMARSWSNITP